jgi:hypothetical protein
VKRDVPEHVQQPADADERRKARGLFEFQRKHATSSSAVR